MKPHVLQTGPLSPSLDAALKTHFNIHPLWKEADPASFLAGHGVCIEGIASSAPVGASTELIAALPALKVISCRGVGLDKIDLAAAQTRGIAVSGTFGVLTDCVADLAFGLVIDVARRLSAADRFVREGRWLKEKYPMTRRVSGKRLGIVGLGQIGRAIAKRAGGFDMEVRYHNRSAAADAPYGYEPSLEALAGWADFLVVAVAGGASTRHLISREVLQALGPDGFLINVARGSVVDEDALVAALTDRSIAGAGLDVYADEPRVPEALLALDNVVLLPHMASGTIETRTDMEDLVMANLKAFFDTGKVLTPAF
ncbi:MAG: 2-hydroxyacid dehydrogenase [Pseudazoarcus pumilus]|nr:2-hydroxyacid dehydrogenase [Pseudazoarcus pumilus]